MRQVSVNLLEELLVHAGSLPLTRQTCRQSRESRSEKLRAKDES